MAERKRTTAGKAGSEARICDAVRIAILERRLAPGTKLQEIPLGAFSACRAPSCGRRCDGSPTKASWRCATGGSPSSRAPPPPTCAHVFAARRAIEVAVVEQVVANAARAEVLALRRLVRDEEAAYRKGERAEGLKLSLAFHARWARCAAIRSWCAI